MTPRRNSAPASIGGGCIAVYTARTLLALQRPSAEERAFERVDRVTQRALQLVDRGRPTRCRPLAFAPVVSQTLPQRLEHEKRRLLEARDQAEEWERQHREPVAVAED